MGTRACVGPGRPRTRQATAHNPIGSATAMFEGATTMTTTVCGFNGHSETLWQDTIHRLIELIIVYL